MISQLAYGAGLTYVKIQRAESGNRGNWPQRY